MKVEKIPFQEKAVAELRMDIADALSSYQRRMKTQVVSLQAPTGAGKTIIAAKLIEDIYFGSTLADGTTFEEQPEAIFVWLSDSPELNEQSKQKIELKTSKLRFGQCVTIRDDSFDIEMLEDGHIYFLNTQKISLSGNLTRHGDDRTYTIWETLDNTIANKSDRLYFIIDEAHRGAKSKRESGKDTTIMQRFIKGYEYTEDGVKRKMRSMPVVLGISATAERFNTLVGNIANVGLLKYVITADEVRDSGLLKDRIVITYPDDPHKNSDMVLLEAAVEEWMKKCIRWHQYTYEQHYANVDPVLVVQVCQGSGGAVTNTNLDDVLSKIEEKVGTRFKTGEVVHCFGEEATLEVHGLDVPHIKASEIADDHKVKVVFFKEALSTGWDCPRAETMMSFAVRHDPTYIAQLLGRMVRTPLQLRVQRDEFLNDVKLYLPHFNKDTVKQVIKELQSTEGGDIPTEINGESLEEPAATIWTVRPPRNPQPRIRQPEPDENQTVIENYDSGDAQATPDIERGETIELPQTPKEPHDLPPIETTVESVGPSSDVAPVVTLTTSTAQPATPPVSVQEVEQLEISSEIDRVKIIDFINAEGYVTYFVRRSQINDYLKSLLDLTNLLTHNVIYRGARDEVIDDVIEMMHSYIKELKCTDQYEALVEQVLQFKLSVQVFDPFGKAIHGNTTDDLTLLSETDLDRQLRNAEAKLGKYGFTSIYGGRFFDGDDPNSYKIDCILFAADEKCRTKLNEYAKKKLNEFARAYRLKIARASESCKKKYHDILADSSAISEQIFAIPENIIVREDRDGTEYSNHLFVSETTGVAKIKLNTWEAPVIEEESRREDFVCWLRNPSRAAWALCLHYEMGGRTREFYPDFLIIRRDTESGYIVDILEPHGDHYKDNLPKAKALAEYARLEDRIGRIQLIRKITDAGQNDRLIRLELTDRNVREKVRRAFSNEELDHIFDTEGFF